MKPVIVSILAAGLLSNSVLAMAEGPVPLKKLMQPAGAEPSVTAAFDDRDQSKPLPTQPAHTHMTSGGKVTVGVGIGLCFIGGVVMVGTAALNSWASSSDRAKLYGASGGAMAGGATLIILGTHRRAAN